MISEYVVCMFDRIRETVSTEDSTKDFEINPQEVITEFERLLERDGVTVNGNKSDVTDEFAEIVNRYDSIESELQQAWENIGDGNVISLLDQFDNDQFDQWQKNHEHTIEVIESVNKNIIELMKEVDIDESLPDESGRFAEMANFLEQVNDAYQVFTYTSDT